VALNFASLLKILPGKKAAKGGVSSTPTFNPQQTANVLTVPQYRDHLTDIFASRTADDSRTLLKNLFKNDPDVSATVSSYLTLANTPMRILVRDLNDQIDREATKQLYAAIKLLTRRIDYTQGFTLKPSLKTINESLRYLLLLRGGIGAELVLDKALAPSEVRLVDMMTVEWYEKAAGQYKPVQKPRGSNTEINLDIPTFFTSFFRRDPTDIYTTSHFVAAINAISARQQVVNDLYRIMQFTGFPRIDVSIVEEVVAKNAPAKVKADPAQLRAWMMDRRAEIESLVGTMRADQAFIHWDSIEPKILNEKNPGAGIDVSSVIEVLNAQNQAGLKTMATIIGRGTSGVNTASVEARIAAMNADELNEPLAEMWQGLFSFMLHMQGYQGFVDVTFEPVEMRPQLELEPQKTMKQARLLQDLSLGNITDEEYHLEMYNRLPPDGAAELSGTGFMNAATASVDAEGVSPNGDPLGRGLASPDSKSARSNTVKRASSSR
jgi:hypothetical protein